MSELLRHPQVMAKAQLEIREVLGPDHRGVITHTHLAQLQYMRMVIKEVLRLHPPAPLITRMTRVDSKILGYDMLKGTAVLINVFAVSRDPKCWKNPLEFIPERFEDSSMDYTGTRFEFTPFGAGRRQCPGIIFATSTLEIALANLIYHFDWVLPGNASPESLDMSEKFGIIIRRRYALELIAIPRGRLDTSRIM
jgi:cytochrome P450